MPFSYFLRNQFPPIPFVHWGLIILFSLIVVVLMVVRKKCSIYRSILGGLTCFMVLFLLDALVGIRVGMERPICSSIDLSAEFQRLICGKQSDHYSILFNLIVFIPLGLFLSEFIISDNRFELSNWHLFRDIFFFVLTLSLLIEILQLLLGIGLFEITDLVTNTVGGIVGAGISFIGRILIRTCG